MSHLLTHAATVVGHVLADVPDPGSGAAPPGKVSEQLVKVLKWALWVVSGMCVTGVLIVGGRMAVMHNRGEGGQHASGLAWVLSACIIVGSATSIVNALI